MANKKAKIIHSRKDLNTKVGCTKVVMKAKYNYRMAIQEARMIRCNQLQESEAAYSEALGENAAMRSTQSTRLCREHVKHMHKLEEWALREENKSCQDFLSACQAILCHALQPLKENLSTSSHVLLGQLPSSLWSVPYIRTPQAEEQPSAATSPRPEPKQSHGQKGSILCEIHGKHVHGWNFLQDLTGRTVKLQKKRDSWLVCLPKAQSCRCLQSWLWPREKSQITLLCHPPLWLIHDSTDDLSNIFRELAKGAGLLGKSIYEIQLSWNGLEELKHTNYSLQSLPKGLRFLRVVPTMESPKVMGLKGIHDSDALQHFMGYTYCPWCGKEGQNEGTMVNHLRTTHYRLDLVCDQYFGCPTVMLDTLHQHRCHSCQK